MNVKLLLLQHLADLVVGAVLLRFDVKSLELLHSRGESSVGVNRAGQVAVVGGDDFVGGVVRGGVGCVVDGSDDVAVGDVGDVGGVVNGVAVVVAATVVVIVVVVVVVVAAATATATGDVVAINGAF